MIKKNLIILIFIFLQACAPVLRTIPGVTVERNVDLYWKSTENTYAGPKNIPIAIKVVDKKLAKFPKTFRGGAINSIIAH